MIKDDLAEIRNMIETILSKSHSLHGQVLELQKKVGDTDEVLCGDCLRVRPFTQQRHEGAELCECGGEFCGCNGCRNTIDALRAGHRSANTLGTINDVKQWCEKTGGE